MRKFIHCGLLFTGTSITAEAGECLVIENGRFIHAGPRDAAPEPFPGDEVLDFGTGFVMPGLSDLHTHLSYGNALGQEDIDLYASMEYRALRALAAAQRMLQAGYTALLDPATSGQVTPAVRDALFVGMFPGPRITASGPALTSHIGLYDFCPSWIGTMPQSSGVLVQNMADAIQEIRKQTKDGVDTIKLAMDGIQGNRELGLFAGFTQEETTAMVRESHRLGRKVVVHARGREGALYAARAGVDIIYHASRIDQDGIQAAKDNGCHICPSLMLLVNNIEFARPGDPSFAWWPDIQRQEFAAARRNLRLAYDAGIPFAIGSETGFAVSPYGEWPAKELHVMQKYLGIPAGELLRMITFGNRALLRDGGQHDSLAPGKRADFIVVDGNPLEDLTVLQDRGKIMQIWMDGARVMLPELPIAIPRHQREAAQGMWSHLYTREAVAGFKRQSLSEYDGPALSIDDPYPEASL